MAQQGGQQAQGGGGNESLDFLWMIVVIVIVIFGLWYFYRAEITQFVFLIRLYEVKLIHIVVDQVNKLLAFLTFPTINLSELDFWARYIETSPENVPFAFLNQVSLIVGRYLAYPVMLVLSILAFIIYQKHVVLKFKSIFSMKTLKKAELSVWPQSKPTEGKDLIGEDLNKGPWAMAMNPLAFCEKHKIVEPMEKDGRSVGKLIRGPAYRVFALQTGMLWPGPNALKIHVKALIAIFSAKANHDSDTANKLLDDIAASAGRGKLNFSGVQAVFKQYYSSKVVQQAVSQHAYLLTVMASLLELARTDGVLASAEFLWLKPLDRQLWYMLNSVGRRVAVAEIAGAFAHWLAEKELKGPIRTPMVESAVKAIEVELQNTLYEPKKDDDE